MKKKLYLTGALCVLFAILCLADTTLFEDVDITGRLLTSGATTNTSPTVTRFTTVSSSYSSWTNTSTGANAKFWQSDPRAFDLELHGSNGIGIVFIEAFATAGGVAQGDVYMGSGFPGGKALGADNSDHQHLDVAPGFITLTLGNQSGAATINGGDDVSDAWIMNCGTFTTPFALNVNGGQMLIPSGSSATWSNGIGGITSVGRLTGSNFTWTAGTLNSVIFIDGAGAIAQNNTAFNFDGTHLSIGATPGTATLNVTATNGANTSMFDSFDNTVSSTIIQRHARGSVATPTALQLNDPIGGISMRPYGATGFSAIGRARMNGFMSENATDTAQGARLEWATTPTGTTNTAVTMVLGSDGALTVTNSITSVLGTPQINTGTSNTLNIIVNNGQGTVTFQNTNTFFTFINAPTNTASFTKASSTPLVNQMLTNNSGARQTVNFTIALTPAVAGTAVARLQTLTGTTTNQSATLQIPPQTAGTYMLQLYGVLSPNDQYWVTNISSGSGATVAVSNLTVNNH